MLKPFRLASKIPALPYFEEEYCPECEQITTFRRDKNWNMFCSSCHYFSYPDPLQKFHRGEYIDYSREKKLVHLDYRFRKVFSNFLRIDRKIYCSDSKIVLVFADLDKKEFPKPFKENESEIKKYETIAVRERIKIFMLPYCYHFKDHAKADWAKELALFRRQRDFRQEIFQKACEANIITQMRLTAKGLFFQFHPEGLIVHDHLCRHLLLD